MRELKQCLSRMPVSLRYLTQTIFIAVLCSTFFYPLAAANLDKLIVPDGFTLSLLTDEVPDARQLALSPQGILYVGSFKSGKLYAVLPASKSQKASLEKTLKRAVKSKVRIIAENLLMPSGLSFIGDDLYVGAVNKIIKFSDIDTQLKQSSKLPNSSIVSSALPDKTHHGWKYLSTGPDGNLYIPIGAPCNICLSENPLFASIQKMNPETGVMTAYAQGVRNSVGLAWHPVTGNLWFSDNGRDMLGDDVPPDEINELSQAGSHFGYPYVHAGDIPDPEFGAHKNPQNFIPPVYKVQAHSATLGLSFNTAKKFPHKYHNALFIAEHGSWNRSSKVGYQVSVLRWEGEQAIYEVFISGWLDKEDNWGRPNDVLFTAEGDLLISDDKAGAIYKLSYTH